MRTAAPAGTWIHTERVDGSENQPVEAASNAARSGCAVTAAPSTFTDAGTESARTRTSVSRAARESVTEKPAPFDCASIEVVSPSVSWRTNALF